MPSSTFSSSAAAVAPARTGGVLRARIVVLAGAILLFAIACECIIRIGFARISRIESRITAEARAARLIRRENAHSPILILGNSLPLLALDMPALSAGMPAGVHVQRYVIEQTGYIDWLYGLRRLFAEGARPATVVLCLSPGNLLSTDTLGEAAAFRLFQASDIVEIASVLGLDRTQTSSLLFAHYSLLYAGRNGLRNFVLNKADPPYAAFLHDALMRPRTPMPHAEGLKTATERLTALTKLCHDYGATFIFLVPAGFDREESAVTEAASQTRTALWAPVHADAWPPTLFIDGYHLNDQGRAAFTQIVAPLLARAAAQ